ncbi:MAG: glucans biosynthesis glucosyltransferase MdoH [Gammaproteobacteria bacterium]
MTDVRSSEMLVPERQAWHASGAWRRVLMSSLIVLQVWLAIREMMSILPYHGTTPVELALLIVFIFLFAGISTGFWMAVFGFVVRRRGGDPCSLMARFKPETLKTVELAPTAILFPIYHEDVERTLAGLRSTYCDLDRQGQLNWFEFFILSDSRDPDIWLKEQEGWYRLCEELAAHGRIHYRRRVINLNRKTGNIADFLRRWGRRFRYMIVMDADSLMKGASLVQMVRLMECAPQVGIIQTNPAIVNARSAYARIQQYANSLYGPLFSEGLAAVQLGDAVFWGHNGILRVAPFMRHCGLKRMYGRGFMQGSILSHDFVEAAYLRRAGYEVWLEPRLGGSYEESPPSLVDDLMRDRRWAHGNLQHMGILFKLNIRFAHRVAFANGIMAYLASPLWFLFIVLSTLEVAQFTLWPVDYFPESNSLYPVWPEWHPQSAILLAFSTAALLFLPKLLAFLDLVLDRQRLRAMGGVVKTLISLLIELAVSVLLAPIRMLAHTRFVLEILLNFNARWAGQNRTQEITWPQALINQAPGGLLAIAWAAFSFWLQPLFFYWSLPIALPLVLGAPVTLWLSRFRLGAALKKRQLLMIPEETQTPDVLKDLYKNPIFQKSSLTAFELGILDPWRNRLHAQLARSRYNTESRNKRRNELVASCNLKDIDALTTADKNWLAQDAVSLTKLHEMAWRATQDSAWGKRLQLLCSESSRQPDSRQ